MTIPAPTNPTTPPDAVEVIEASGLTNSLKFASPEEALAGTEAAKMMSPATTKHVLDNTELGNGYPINDGGDGLEELWSANYLTESVGDTAAMLDGILGDGDEIASLKGNDGATGLSVLSGPYPPTIEGVDGEFWIDTTSWQIYGPKTDGAWGTGTTIKGADGADGVDGTNGTDGADGEDGNTVLSGASDPTTEGVVGDWYINTTSLQIFGPKTSEGWGTGTDLQGADGAIGPTFSISEDHFFADATARDAYFTSNPSELVAGVVISNEAGSTGYQQYSGSAWVDKEFAVEGGGGSSLPTGGATGSVLAKKSATDGDVEWLRIVKTGNEAVAVGCPLTKERPGYQYLPSPATDPAKVTQPMAANTFMYLYPFDVIDNVTLSEISLSVVTGVTGTGVYISIYDSDPITGLPANLLLSGSVSTATSGIKTIAGTVALTPGRYWWGRSRTNDAGTPTLRGYQVSSSVLYCAGIFASLADAGGTTAAAKVSNLAYNQTTIQEPPESLAGVALSATVIYLMYLFANVQPTA